MWQYVLTAISFIMLFGFMFWGIFKFGIQSCYSAYAPLWDNWFPKLNIWSMVTALSAALMVPVLLQQSEGSIYQFLGFLAPVSLFAVAGSPNYQTDKRAWWMHQIGAWSAVLFIVLYTILIPHMLWIIITYIVVALIVTGVCALCKKKDTWMLWAEQAVYLSIYTIMFKLISDGVTI